MNSISYEIAVPVLAFLFVMIVGGAIMLFLANRKKTLAMKSILSSVVRMKLNINVVLIKMVKCIAYK